MSTTICPITGLIETKARCVRRNGRDYCIPSDTNRTSWYEWYALVSWYTNLPPFLPSLSPTTPITPYNPPNSPLKQINCLRPPRKNSATTENDNKMFSKGSFPLQPSISKATPLANRAGRKRELAWGSDWWMVYDYFTWRIDFILQLVGYVKMLHLLFLAKYYGIGEIS